MRTKKDWYSYSEFNFGREQMVWAIKHLEELREGDWPRRYGESGYVGDDGRRVAKEGNFVKPTIIAAEVDWRLEQVMRGDREWLISEIIAENPQGYWQPESYHALNYITGWKRKGDYKAWLKMWETYGVGY